MLQGVYDKRQSSFNTAERHCLWECSYHRSSHKISSSHQKGRNGKWLWAWLVVMTTNLLYFIYFTVKETRVTNKMTKEHAQ